MKNHYEKSKRSEKELQPLEIVIGYDVVPAFTDYSFVDKIVGLRVELAKESS